MLTVSYICKNGIAHSLKTNILFSHLKCWEFEPFQVSAKISLLLFWKKEGYYFIDNSSIKLTYLRLPIGMARIMNALYKPGPRYLIPPEPRPHCSPTFHQGFAHICLNYFLCPLWHLSCLLPEIRHSICLSGFLFVITFKCILHNLCHPRRYFPLFWQSLS